MSESPSAETPPELQAVDPGVLETHQRRFEVGAVVFDDGDPGHALYFIRSGEIELTRRGPSGARCVGKLGPGEFFGEQGALLAGPRCGRATVICEAELLEVDAEVFEEMCLERPEIGIRISRALAARAQALEQRLASLGGEDDVRAMLRVLLRLAQPAGESARVDGTLRTLAAEAGLGLLAAHHALQHLLERKLVRLVDDVLVVPDLAGLSAVLEG